MSKTIQQILGYVSLTGVIKAVETGIPDNLPAAFNKVGKKVIGDAGRYTVIKGTRQTSRRVEYGAGAMKRALKDVGAQDVKLISTKELIEINPQIMQALRNYSNYDVQNLGIEELDRQQAEFRVYFDNLRLACKYSMLWNGHIWFDLDGNLLASASGNLVDVNFQIPANNQGQLNGIIAQSWANQNTDIPGQIRNLRVAAAKATGYPLKHAFYGVNVPSYMSQNAYVLDYLARNPSMQERYLQSAEIPNGLFDLQWHPVYTSFFEDNNNVNQEIFSHDAVVFTPEINNDVYELMEGSNEVPASFAITADIISAMNSLKQVWGMFSYAYPVLNPVSVQQIVGDTFLPVWKVPASLYEAVVAF